MKFLTSILIFIVSLSVFADIGPVNRSANLNFDGSIKNGSKEQIFIKVINRAGGTLADGSVVVWESIEDDGASVTTSTTAGAFPACIIAESCADDKLCKCQTYGYKSNILFDVSSQVASVNQMMYLSESNAGYVQAEIPASVSATDVPIGMFYDTVSASGSVEGFIRLR